MVKPSSHVIWSGLELHSGIRERFRTARTVRSCWNPSVQLKSQPTDIRSPGTKTEELRGTEKVLMEKACIVLGP